MRNTEIDALLERVHAGDREASADVYGLVYSELRTIAKSQLRREKASHTLSPTALVNEAYLRLFSRELNAPSRAYFFGAAAEAMRRVLIDHARKRLAEKRGSDAKRVTLSEVSEGTSLPQDVDVILLDQALSALETHDERLSLVVKLRYFVDLSLEETADVLDVSTATVKRDWAYARAWLFEKMSS